MAGSEPAIDPSHPVGGGREQVFGAAVGAWQEDVRERGWPSRPADPPVRLPVRSGAVIRRPAGGPWRAVGPPPRPRLASSWSRHTSCEPSETFPRERFRARQPAQWSRSRAPSGPSGCEVLNQPLGGGRRARRSRARHTRRCGSSCPSTGCPWARSLGRGGHARSPTRASIEQTDPGRYALQRAHFCAGRDHVDRQPWWRLVVSARPRPAHRERSRRDTGDADADGRPVISGSPAGDGRWTSARRDRRRSPRRAATPDTASEGLFERLSGGVGVPQRFTAWRGSNPNATSGRPRSVGRGARRRCRSWAGRGGRARPAVPPSSGPRTS